LILLSLSNLFELFVPRLDEASSLARLPIQAISITIIILMSYKLILLKLHWNYLTISIIFFIGLLIIYFLFYFTLIRNVNISDFSPYLKMLLWLITILYFYEMFILYGINTKLFTFYILTFISSVTKKIFESGGDTASLPLLFIIPLILVLLEGKKRIYFLTVVIALIFISLRRTAILSLVFCLPFVYWFIRTNLKPRQLISISILILCSLFTIWFFLGDAISYRFEELLQGDSRGEYGSGRTVFYNIVWRSWLYSKNYELVFGHGMGSVKNLLIKTYGIDHAHNDFLEIIHTWGLVGLLIWTNFLYNLHNLRVKLKNTSMLNIFYVCLISYVIIALTSGYILRATAVPFAMTES
jgi:hypothetical protein